MKSHFLQWKRLEMIGRPKGTPKTGGRVAGKPNAATVEFRETVTKLLSDNAANVAIWLQQVAQGHGDAKPDPGKALDMLAKLAEYAAPKLARTEVTGAGGGPVVIAASPLDERL